MQTALRRALQRRHGLPPPHGLGLQRRHGLGCRLGWGGCLWGCRRWLSLGGGCGSLSAGFRGPHLAPATRWLTHSIAHAGGPRAVLVAPPLGALWLASHCRAGGRG